MVITPHFTAASNAEIGQPRPGGGRAMLQSTFKWADHSAACGVRVDVENVSGRTYVACMLRIAKMLDV
jgi:hypothetical protein